MEELQESELGTQEYWDRRYKNDFLNFKDHEDPGEIWYGKDTVKRTIKWITKQKDITKSVKILDVGCGNGMFLIDLFPEGYTNLFGVDYSEDAVALAKSVAQKHKYEIQFFTGNILKGLDGLFGVIHDKGTYDAITLNSDVKTQRTKYLENIHAILEPDGVFIIASGNWTRKELDEHFKNLFVHYDDIPAPQIRFGGQTGSTVTCVIYKKA